MKSRSNAKLAIVTTAQAVHVDRWEWRQLIASEQGPASPTTRYVLHMVAMFMDDDGRNCWPSQASIAARAALTTRAVKKHLAIARRTAWLEVTDHYTGRPGWRRNSYAPIVPAALHPAVLRMREKEPNRRRWITPEDGEPGSPHRGTTFPRMGNDVPTTLIRDSVIDSVQRGAAVDKSSRQRSKPAAGDRSKDDLKNRSGGRADRSAALRTRITDATKLMRTSRAPIATTLSDDELAGKVRALRSVGQRDGDIRRALASQASAAQLTRVLKSAGR